MNSLTTLIKENPKAGFLAPVCAIGDGNTLLCTTTIEKIVTERQKGIVEKNPDNRGTGTIDYNRVAEIAGNFKIGGFGEPELILQSDGSFMINDGHHRIEALVELSKNEIFQKIKDYTIALEVKKAKNSIESYAIKNSGKLHTILQKLTDSRLALGQSIELFLQNINTAPFFGVNMLESDKYVQIASLLLAISEHKGGKNLTYKDLVKYRSTVNKNASKLPHELRLNLRSSDVTNLVNSINYVLETMRYFVKISDSYDGRKAKAKLAKYERQIVGNSLFFLLLVWDKYSGVEMFTDLTPNRLASALNKKAEELVHTLSLLSGKSLTKAIPQIYTLLRTKTESVMK